MRSISGLLQFGYGVTMLVVSGGLLWLFGRAMGNAGTTWSMLGAITLVTGFTAGLTLTLVGLATARIALQRRLLDLLLGRRSDRD